MTKTISYKNLSIAAVMFVAVFALQLLAAPARARAVAPPASDDVSRDTPAAGKGLTDAALVDQFNQICAPRVTDDIRPTDTFCAAITKKIIQAQARVLRDFCAGSAAGNFRDQPVKDLCASIAVPHIVTSGGTRFSVTFSSKPGTGVDKKFATAMFQLSFSSPVYEGEVPIKVTLYSIEEVKQCSKAPCPTDEPKAFVSRQFSAKSCKKSQVSNDDAVRATVEDGRWTCVVSTKVAKSGKIAWEKSGDIVISGGVNAKFSWKNGKQVTVNERPSCPPIATPQCAPGSIAKTYVTDVESGCATTFCEPIEVCTDDEYPVCAKVDIQCIQAPCKPVSQTFSNACKARKAGATVVAQGYCDKPTGYACTRESNPVCGADGNTYGNPCAAKTDGVRVAAPGRCVQEGPNPPNTCPQEKPVVCSKESGTRAESYSDKYGCKLTKCVTNVCDPLPEGGTGQECPSDSTAQVEIVDGCLRVMCTGTSGFLPIPPPPPEPAMPASSAAPSNSFLGSLLQVFGFGR